MAITQPPLPFAEDALAPDISAETLHYHYGKHHKAYVDKTNDAVKDGPLADASVEAIVAAAHKDGNKGLFNNSAQAWNHAFYWNCLAPGGARPSGELAAAIDRDFGSYDAFAEKLVTEAVNHFASGWAWLVEKDGKLSVTSYHDADTPLVHGVNPLFTIDVWEHAYYIDKRNDRKAYVQGMVDKLANWDFAADNLARGTAWVQPA